jgi:hypothetical protein
VSEFVEECRREWKRLRVPRTIADEMADDLTADLQEAEADGASVEEVLGSGASDARAFAAAWASERGIVRRRSMPRIRGSRLIAFVVLLVIVAAAAGAAVVMRLASSDHSGAPVSTTLNISPSIVPAGVIGTSVEGATVPPSNVALSVARRTVLHRRPRSITIVFANTGGKVVAPAHLTVQIDEHTYRYTVRRMLPDSRKSLHIALPAGLPRRFVIRATTRPVPGETNTANNRATWRVAVPA